LVASAFVTSGQTVAEASGNECRWQEYCKTKTPTATPQTPTSTPETPTATPETPTSTPETPTSTPTSTSTPQDPTATPQDPTATPEDPESTPTETTESLEDPGDPVLAEGPDGGLIEEVLALPASGDGGGSGSGLSLVAGLAAMTLGGLVWLTGVLWSSSRRTG
jgi:hypothetical protein